MKRVVYQLWLGPAWKSKRYDGDALRLDATGRSQRYRCSRCKAPTEGCVNIYRTAGDPDYCRRCWHRYKAAVLLARFIGADE